MGQISTQEAADLLAKLVLERVPTVGFLMTACGIRAELRGFLDSATVANGLVVSATTPPSDGHGFINVPVANREWLATYGEIREFPPEFRERITGDWGESALVLEFPDSGDSLSLFFTV